MFERNMRPRQFPIVLLGPMGNTQLAPTGKLAYSEHLPNIHIAVDACRQLLRSDGSKLDPVAFWAERIATGGIAHQVFFDIDRADMAIVDISSRSPNVFYEIALVHALGLPIFLIDYNEPINDIPHYLKDQKIIQVGDFLPNELTAALHDAFRRLDPGLRLNPITNFYTVPLVDASAASGLATGYFYNFVSKVIADGSGFLSRMSRRKGSEGITQLAVVRPTAVQQHDQARQEMEQIPGFREHIYRDSDEDNARSYAFKSAGSFIIDYPTPLDSITASTSYIKIKRLLKQFPSGDADLPSRLDEKLISTFMNTLVHLAEETPGSNPSKLQILSVQELTARFRPS